MPPQNFAEWLASWPWSEGAMIFFGFAWGSMLGSFINVVVHRVPLGASIVTTPSRCPRCGTSIRPHDNVPVLGWLWLGGRCRACREPIAATYPLVEAGCGVIVMVLAVSELVGGGRWLASYAGEYPTSIDRLLRGDWGLLATLILHAAVALTVVTWSLLDGVGYRVSRSRLAIPLVLAVVGVALIPIARPHAIWTNVPAPGGAEAMVGAAAGGLLGLCARGQGVRWGLPLLGSVLGWQVVGIVAIVTAVVARVGRPWLGSAERQGLLLAAVGTLAMGFGGLLRSFVGS